MRLRVPATVKGRGFGTRWGRWLSWLARWKIAQVFGWRLRPISCGPRARSCWVPPSRGRESDLASASRRQSTFNPFGMPCARSFPTPVMHPAYIPVAIAHGGAILFTPTHATIRTGARTDPILARENGRRSLSVCEIPNQKAERERSSRAHGREVPSATPAPVRCL